MTESFKIIKKSDLAPLSHNIDDYPNGIVLNVDKPYKWTSADAVRKIKFQLQRHFNKKSIKVGHAGTLDPLATGILLVCIGKATKKAETLQAERKEYIAQIKFGATTPCFDCEKEEDQTFPFEHITLEMLKDICATFIGEQLQVPPIFSAKLVDGVRAYNMAREGQECEMRSSLIHIYDLEILGYSENILSLRVECSKGTYIRALARDLGVAAQSGAYLVGLQRTISGQFNIEDALSIDDCMKLFE